MLAVGLDHLCVVLVFVSNNSAGLDKLVYWDTWLQLKRNRFLKLRERIIEIHMNKHSQRSDS